MSRPRTLLLSLWRTLVAAAGAFWLGGLLFYISIVIHTAHDVLGSQREVGFVTRAVTQQINRIGVAVLIVLLVHLATLSRSRDSHPRPPARWPLLATWLAMAALQAALLALHPRLDQYLDPAAHAVIDRHGFRHLHNTYMLLTTAQLAAGLLHTWAGVAAWSWVDRRAAES